MNVNHQNQPDSSQLDKMKHALGQKLTMNFTKPSLSKMAGKAANFLGTTNANMEKLPSIEDKRQDNLIDLGPG